MAFDDGAPKQNFFRSFSPWAKWAERGRLDDGHGFSVHDYSGVYLLAHFDNRPPSGTAEYLDDAIFYVGEAVWLKRRWRQFQDSARDGLPGHSGGHTYRASSTRRSRSRGTHSGGSTGSGFSSGAPSEENTEANVETVVKVVLGNSCGF